MQHPRLLSKRQVTALQRDILTVLRINPTPLMTAADIATVFNQWPGKRRNSQGMGACCASLRDVSHKFIWAGRWAGIKPSFGYASSAYTWGHWPTKATYWYLTERNDEVHIDKAIWRQPNADVSKLFLCAEGGGGGGGAFEPSSDDRCFFIIDGDGT